MRQINQKNSLKKGEKTESWAPDEDEMLIERVRSGAFSTWIEVSSSFPNRSAHACRARYAYHKKRISNLPKLQLEDPVKWTLEEDQLLLAQLVNKKPWNQIYKLFPHRTKVACSTRFRVLKMRDPELAKTDFRRKQKGWSKEEDQTLIKLVECNQFMTWEDLASHLPNRSLEAIRKHYSNLKKLNPLLPSLNNGRVKRWSEDEDRKLILNVNSKTLNWNEIAKLMVDRSVDACRSRYEKLTIANLELDSKEKWKYDDEQKLILSVVSGKYSDWIVISNLFQNRSSADCQRHYRKLQDNNPHLPSLSFVLNKIRPKLKKG